MTECIWSRKLLLIASRLGIKIPSEIAARICMLDDSVAFSVTELFDFVSKFVVVSDPLARKELGNDIESSLMELYRVVRGVYGRHIPRSLYDALKAVMQRPDDKEQLAFLLGALREFLDELSGT
ncbi:hypothetical protein PYJP_20150 [Pyrofollis japonicus]|uniref:hypothetical protein n=1 Tax=Pyrofollis japonicus TaxID=3060460 RepID=UPI00295BDF2C|nr:hypothetical protein [Pyrofollis japonicus]BEP18663.1 hypothetical protein PYJP_20150 [Pyrofollis japonicus]